MSRKSPSIFRLWHRYLGVVSVFFVIILAVTGLLLLFAAPLGFDQMRWGGPVVAAAYNQNPKTEPIGIKLGDEQWAVMVDGLVYIAAADPIALDPPMMMATKDEQFIYIANEAQTLVVLHDGQLVERLAGVDFVGTTPTPIPDAVKSFVINRYAGRGMAASRILLDIHTGRFFGKIGVWLMALASVFLLILSFTGLYMWFRRPNGRRAKNG